MAQLPFEPYKIKMVEPITQSTKRKRRRWIGAAHYNLFALSSDQVMVDMLTDSGTGAMSDRQWAALMQGDESYAGSRSFAQLKQVVEKITGFPHLIPTHQGRGAENVLFSVLVHKNDWVPGNAHFDTTKGHIEWRKAQAIDCTVAEAYDPSHMAPFKGNIDLEKLEATYQQAQTEKRSIPLVVLTLTCNSVGGQPVSMANIKAVSEWCQSKEIPLILDAARLAENAYFIKKREEGFQHKSIKSIVRQMCGHAHGMTMSAKKDGLANMGGFVALHDQKLYERCNTYTIMFEGFLTYGGLSGRDMSALAVGLDEATEQNYLHHRVGQVAYLGQRLADYGVPVQQPFGGHAVYIDADDFVPNISREEFLQLGFEAITVAVNGAVLDKSFVGQKVDAAFLKCLPKGVDPCGENGEFHTFCYHGPIFKHPVPYKKGKTIGRTYPDPKGGASVPYWFCDILPD